MVCQPDNRQKRQGTIPSRQVLSGKYRIGLQLEIYMDTEFEVNAERKSKVDDNTAKMQSIKWLGV